jgi:ATP phosphoribosyltransferase regulatory subunit
MVTDRAYIEGGRIGPRLGDLDAEIGRILAVLSRTGGQRVEPAALQPADVLLDLYGEDIRARAFVTRDDRAEMMLRPDFTVPIVRMHLGTGNATGRYVYCGPVWRRQAFGSDRPREYLQAGLEIFGDRAPAQADAEILCLIRAALGEAPVRLVTGDSGLVLAGIAALETSPVRQAALRRHLWRPARFQEMLGRYGAGQAARSAARATLLDAARDGDLPRLMTEAGQPIGLRGADEVAERVARLVAEAETPPLDTGRVRLLEYVLEVKGTSSAALAELRAIARELPGLARAVDRLEARLDAFACRGFEPGDLAFEAAFGRTTLEYYDGFVFGAVALGRDDLPPVASGGRYDALTRVLGQGADVPAVGGIVRPEALLALCSEAAPCG